MKKHSFKDVMHKASIIRIVLDEKGEGTVTCLTKKKQHTFKVKKREDGSLEEHE